MSTETAIIVAGIVLAVAVLAVSIGLGPILHSECSRAGCDVFLQAQIVFELALLKKTAPVSSPAAP